MTDAEKETLAGMDSYRQRFIEVMEDDLNTADAISTIFELVTAINTAVKDGASKEFAEKALELLMELASILGLLQQDKEETVEIEPELQALIDSMDIDIEHLEESILDEASGFGRSFAYSGGLSAAVAEALKEYEAEIGCKIPAMPLCDVGGTLVLCK